MCTAAIHLTLTELIILQIGIVILGVTFYFYLVSRRVLLQTIKKAGVDLKKDSAKKPTDKIRLQKNNIFLPELPKKRKGNVFAALNTSSIESMKDVIMHHQKAIDNLIFKVNKAEVDAAEKETNVEESYNLLQRVLQLEEQLAAKETEIKKWQEQEEHTQEMTARLEEVYEAFGGLQDKVTHLEEQAALSKTISQELKIVKEKYSELEQDKVEIETVMQEENRNLRQQLGEAEKLLAQARLQQKKLSEKVTFLQDVNKELQSALDNNQKLKNKLRRIGELESILSLTEEEKEFFKKHS